jgi:nucleoside-diphosphate-sugar epimerase
MAKYLVTGAAGFIASRVAEMLLDDGHTIVSVDNMNDAYDVRMKDYRLGTLSGKRGFQFEKIDIADRQALMNLGERTGPFDAIINLAARAGVRASLKDPWVYLRTNVEGTLNLLELCRQQDIPKFVLASTSSIYGQDAPLPTPEHAESSRPLQPYAASKKAAEVMCYAYHTLYDIDVTVFRYFTVYGPAGRPDMVMFRFIQWIQEGRSVIVNGDGEQSRGFTYLDDIARGTILGLKPVGYDIFNLGGHETIKINELVQMLESRIGHEADVVNQPLHPADLRSNWADVSKAGRSLGWEPQVSIEAGVEATIAWYIAERSWASLVDTSD